MAASDAEIEEEKSKKYFLDFVIGLGTRLLDIVDQEKSEFNCTPELNTISQAVLTLSFLHRIHYRRRYTIIGPRIKDINEFSDFCAKDLQTEKLPYFFTFLLNVSEKFEIFLYLRQEGYNYFAVFLRSFSKFKHYSLFLSLGGAEKCAEFCRDILDLTEGIQVLVNTENPCRRILFTLEESLSEIETKYFDLSQEESFATLLSISKALHSGLQQYAKEPVLPFIILRHLLDGRFPRCDYEKALKADEKALKADEKALNDDEKALNDAKALVHDKAFLEKHFSRCFIPDIMTGVAYRGRTRKQIRITLGIQKEYEITTILDEPKGNNFKVWQPLINDLYNKDKMEGNGDTDFVSPKENERNKKKVKELSGDKTPTLQTGCSSEDEACGSRSKPNVTPKPVLNTDHLNVCRGCHSASSCRRIYNPAAGSSRYQLRARQRKNASKYESTENDQKSFETFALHQLTVLMNQTLNERKKKLKREK